MAAPRNQRMIRSTIGLLAILVSTAFLRPASARDLTPWELRVARNPAYAATVQSVNHLAEQLLAIDQKAADEYKRTHPGVLPETKLTLPKATASAFDWCNLNKVSEAHRQRTGDCWATAATEALECSFLIFNNRRYDLSVQPVIDQLRYHAEKIGGKPSQACDFFLNDGHHPDGRISLYGQAWAAEERRFGFIGRLPGAMWPRTIDRPQSQSSRARCCVTARSLSVCWILRSSKPTTKEEAQFAIAELQSRTAVELIHSVLPQDQETCRSRMEGGGTSHGESSLRRSLYGRTSMTNRWLALPTRSVEVERTFSLPQPSAPSSSFRTSRSMVAVTSTSNFPACIGRARERARVRVQLQPARSLQGILGVLDVPEAGDRPAVLPHVAQGAIGGDLAAVLRAHLGRAAPACCRSPDGARRHSRTVRSACPPRPPPPRGSRSCWLRAEPPRCPGPAVPWPRFRR